MGSACAVTQGGRICGGTHRGSILSGVCLYSFCNYAHSHHTALGVLEYLELYMNIPYRPGDVVKVRGEKGEQIIREVQCDIETDGELCFEYGTNVSAWHNHDDLTLVRPCDSESLALLLKDLKLDHDFREGEDCDE